MIKGVCLENFKCFKTVNIKTSYLNVFSGLNGMGKSTTIQSLLLLKQSIEQGFVPNNILLNGEYVNIGSGQDLLYEYANNEQIIIALSTESSRANATINYENGSDVLQLEEYDEQITKWLDVPFEYLNAERSAPKSIYPKSSYYIDSKSQLGINGEYTTHYLSKHQDDKIPWDSCNGNAQTIMTAVQYWLNEISPNVKLSTTEIEKTDLARLGYYYTDNEKSSVYRPTNVGFGITYILPVVVALIKAEPGSILIIENPEAHLHPKGQRKIGELLARCSASNVQLFVETHSDHVLNGIRIAVKNQILLPENVNFMFFDKKEKDGVIMHTVESPEINETGKLNYWPDGFFDEWDKALDEII